MATPLENDLLLSPKRQSIQLLSKLIPDVNEDILHSLLPIIFDTISKRTVTPDALDILRQKGQADTVDRLFGGLLTLVQVLIRQKPEAIKESNLRPIFKTLKFSDASANFFISSLLERKPILLGALFQYYPQVKKIDWRVDITLSSSALNKSFKTVIILHLQLSNGECHSFEISIVKFHMLRLNVATLLRDFQMKEKPNKIQ